MAGNAKEAVEDGTDNEYVCGETGREKVSMKDETSE